MLPPSLSLISSFYVFFFFFFFFVSKNFKQASKQAIFNTIELYLYTIRYIHTNLILSVYIQDTAHTYIQRLPRSERGEKRSNGTPKVHPISPPTHPHSPQPPPQHLLPNRNFILPPQKIPTTTTKTTKTQTLPHPKSPTARAPSARSRSNLRPARLHGAVDARR